MLEHGALGFFWPISGGPGDLESEPERGYARQVGAWIEIDVLDEDPFARTFSEVSPEGMLAALARGSAFFAEMHGPYGTLNFVGGGASSKSYRARTAVMGVPIDRVRSCRIRSMQADLAAVTWAGLNPVSEIPHIDGGRVRSWQIAAGPVEELSHPLTRGRSLTVSGRWSVSGEHDLREMRSLLAVRCSSNSRPRKIHELLGPLMHIQNLVSFAAGGFVAAESGTVELDLTPADDDERAPRADLWHGALMACPDGVRPVDRKRGLKVPRFSFSSIGGVKGLARWVGLCESHPRAVGPVVSPYRVGTTSSPVRLLDVAAAIEYWVKANRSAKWATAKKKSFPRRLAERCPSFEAWCGGSAADWAAEFWDTNNDIKHNPSFDVDPQRATDLAESGRLLLACSLLNRVALNQRPSEELVRFSFDALQDRVRRGSKAAGS